MARTLPRLPRRVGVGVALSLVVATIAGLAIASPGFDARRTPVDDGAVWAIQSGENLRYARVNVELGELDIVKRVDNPTAVVQSQSGAMVLTSNYARFAQVSAAATVDLIDDAPELVDSPSGTEDVRSAGDYVVFRTAEGEIYTTVIGADLDATPVRIDLERAGPESDPVPWISDAVALRSDGLVVGWNAELRTVSVFDLSDGAFRTVRELDEAVAPGTDAQVSLVADRWVIFDPAEGELIIEGRESEPSALELSGTGLLQHPSLAGGEVLLSDEGGLVAVELSTGEASILIDQGGLGAPAVITELDGARWAAWLSPGSAAGTLWRSDTREQSELDYAGADIGDEPSPVLQSTGTRMALNDAPSGWVWTVPEGRLVPSSQDWTAGEQETRQDEDQEVVSAAVDPKPPVVTDDEFGVRAGASATLPVLLNDSDPNGDVLTIVPTSLDGLDPGFGTITTAGEDQSIVVQVAPGASGSAQFSYRAEDGTTDGGLVSERAAVVTLTVSPEGQNSPPVWCDVEGCTAERPAPQVGPGSSVEFDWLRGWVDPDGDPIFISRAEVVDGTAVAAATDAGRVLVQHTNPNDAGPRIELEVGVSDVRGAETIETLAVPVTDSPAIIAESFAIVAQTGSPVDIDPTPYMSGGSGPLTVISAIPTREGRGEVSLNAATGAFTFTAESAGSYVVDWTVSDGVREEVARARITLRDAAEERLTVAPVVAFVRPQEDATIDVFPAISNPAGHVLLLSDVTSTPAGGSSLSATTVGRDLLRVSGTTATLQPGLLGEVGYTVSDGTGRPSATARGAVTVYLLPVPPAAPPIAVDDAVVVRAGERVDVPVLENDVAVQGNAIAFDPRGTEAEAGLAFTTTRTLRILAPPEAGTYSVRYSIYSVGHPALTDVGTVRVTVLPDGANAAPVPRTLFGRVVSGGSVTIPFSSLGVDPDGDEVFLETVVDQPEVGAARISADGRSITYASVLGDSGEVSFGYRVRDSLGLSGDGVVRIGVLAADEDPSPIAFSDYVQVTLGDDSQVVVRPLDNDSDPARTRLSLLGEPTPNVSTSEGFETEYQAALDRLVSVDGDVVTFRSGSELGTFSYLYDVVNEFGDVSRGTIVLRVVRESVIATPVISDTVLTAESRASFEDGVDVVTGRVSWPGGAVSSLSLALWGDQPGVAVQGSTIRGALPERRLVIPFELSGTDFLGQEVVSYGFLVVPGPLDLPPTVRAGAPQIEVKEREQIGVELEDFVVRPAGTSLELDSSGVRASGQRSTATCAATSDLAVNYVAGENSPWRDFCIVPVRYEGQESWTHLTVAIRVVPGDPQPELRSASLEISPGDELVYDLGSMTTWQGDEQTDAAYSVSGATGSFEIISDSSTQVLTIRGLDTAVPGTVEVASIGITNSQYEGVLPAGLTLRVGPAPSTLPKGGTVTQECSVSQNGTQCSIRVIGGAGEVNPLPGTPLVLTGVTQPESCPSVSFSVGAPDAVTATWTQQTPGAACSASFSVRDAQGRESASDRVGTIILDFQGLPAAAASVSQVGFDSASATLSVVPGDAAASYPALTGFDIVRNGATVASCSVQGSCTAITGLENGAKDRYEAFAVNSQGRALAAPSVEAWAYAVPPNPRRVVPTPTVPSGEERFGWLGNLADLEITGVSSDTAQLEIRAASDGALLRTITPANGGPTIVERLAVGTNTGTSLTITPLSRFEAPPGRSVEANQLVVDNVHGVAAPVVSGLSATRGGAENTLSVTATAAADAPGSAIVEWTVQSRTGGGGAFPNCGSATGWAAAPINESVAVDANVPTEVGVCVRTRFGGGSFGLSQASTTGMYFDAPETGPELLSGFVIGSPRINTSNKVIVWSLSDDPEFANAPSNFDLVYFSGGAESSDFPGLPNNSAPSISVRYCHEDLTAADTPSVEARCSPATAVTAEAGSLDRQFRVSYSDDCVTGSGEPATWPSPLVSPPGKVTAVGIELRRGGQEMRYLVRAETGTVQSDLSLDIDVCEEPPPTEPPPTEEPPAGE